MRAPRLFGSFRREYFREQARTGNLSPGYGERRRERELAKFPLFPDLVADASEYDRRMIQMNIGQARRIRAGACRNWLKARAFRATASDEDWAEFLRQWHYVPKDSGYAADIITQIERRKAEVSA